MSSRKSGFSSPPHFSGPSNPMWKGGKHVTSKGYVRLTAGPFRNLYEHRVRMMEMLRDPISFMLSADSIKGRHVHHMDFNRANNREGNLLLIDRALHNGAHGQREQDHNGHWQPRRICPFCRGDGCKECIWQGVLIEARNEKEKK